MLASLKPLDKNDFLTIVFDGLALSTHDATDATSPTAAYTANTTMMEGAVERQPQGGKQLQPPHNEFVRRVLAYATLMLNCTTTAHFESQPLGHWGHAVRNKYRSVLENVGGDFVLHVDDDDMILPGGIEAIKAICHDTSTLYLFRTYVPGRNPFWNIPGVVRLGNVGTPSGIVPMAANKNAVWGLSYGGDFEYYAAVVAHVKRVAFVDKFIYQCMPPRG
jgi:hypothetical protein